MKQLNYCWKDTNKVVCSFNNLFFHIKLYFVYKSFCHEVKFSKVILNSRLYLKIDSPPRQKVIIYEFCKYIHWKIYNCEGIYISWGFDNK